MNISDIKQALNTYRCQFSMDDNQDGMPLVDMLTPGTEKTINVGKCEIEYLAEHIYCEIKEAENGQSRDQRPPD